MRKLSLEEIVASFPKKDRKLVRVSVDLSVVTWEDLDFLSWEHSSGHIAYVVYDKPYVKGLVLYKEKPGNSKVVRMCDWCKTIHGGRGITIYSSPVINNRKIVKYISVCSDLQCSLLVRGKKNLGPNQMRETISEKKKIDRLNDGVRRFFDSVYQN